MKKLILIICLSLSIGGFAQLIPDSIYYYNSDGSENWWYVQKDVFSFRNDDGSPYIEPHNTYQINSIIHHPYSSSKQNEVKFNPSTGDGTRWDIMNNIRGKSSTEYVTLTVTKNKQQQNDYSQSEYNLLDNLILVNFSDAEISETEVESFMQRNSLGLYHKPSNALPVTTWTYVFSISNEYENTFAACREIFNNEQGFITRCIPNIEGLFKPSTEGCSDVGEMSEFNNTNAPDALWHIKNNGGAPIGGFGNGTANADAKICDCWGEGYHGEGIKIAVIDFGGFDYTHYDMQGQFLEGYDFINGGIAYNSSFWDAGNPEEHGMATSSIIAAKANSSTTHSAVGVAYNAKIIPMLINGTTAQIVMAVQKALELDADIINMSFGYTTLTDQFGQSYMYDEIDKARKLGRNGLGTVTIASTGNDDQAIYNWPGAEFVTIGVGASDPKDYRGSSSQNYNSWGWNGGSNYSIDDKMYNRYHVVAPGTLIYTSSTKNPLTNPEQKNAAWNGTSFSTPLTAGVVAILLSKNQGLTADEIQEVLTNNADKVHQDRYNYNAYPNAPGFNNEMFEGRLNCIASLNNITVGLEDLSFEENLSPVKLAYLDENEAKLLFDKNINLNGCQVKIYSLSGQEIDTYKVAPSNNEQSINSSSYPKGIYLINIIDNKGKYTQTLKYAK